MPWVGSFYNPSLWRVFFTEGHHFSFLFIFSFSSWLVYAVHILVWLIPVLLVQKYMHALSRHKYCSLFLVPSLDLCTDGGRCRCRCRCRFFLLMTVLSTTSIIRLMSWVLAGDITVDKGIPSLSVKKCLFVQTSLLLSVGLFPAVIAPT